MVRDVVVREKRILLNNGLLIGVASWHVPLDEIKCLFFLTKILPSSTTFADLFVWGMVGFFLVTHLPVV